MFSSCIKQPESKMESSADGSPPLDKNETNVSSTAGGLPAGQLLVQQTLTAGDRPIISTTDNDAAMNMDEPQTHDRDTQGQANTASELGWRVLDGLRTILTVVNQALSGQPFQGAVAVPLQVINMFQVSSILSNRIPNQSVPRNTTPMAKC
jgi:hypothetical protein